MEQKQAQQSMSSIEQNHEQLVDISKSTVEEQPNELERHKSVVFGALMPDKESERPKIS